MTMPSRLRLNGLRRAEQRLQGRKPPMSSAQRVGTADHYGVRQSGEDAGAEANTLELDEHAVAMV